MLVPREQPVIRIGAWGGPDLLTSGEGWGCRLGSAMGPEIPSITLCQETQVSFLVGAVHSCAGGGRIRRCVWGPLRPALATTHFTGLDFHSL